MNKKDKQKTIELFTDIKNVRDAFSYINEALEITDNLITNHPTTYKAILNARNKVAYALNKLIKEQSELLDKDIKLSYLPEDNGK